MRCRHPSVYVYTACPDKVAFRAFALLITSKHHDGPQGLPHNVASRNFNPKMV